MSNLPEPNSASCPQRPAASATTREAVLITLVGPAAAIALLTKILHRLGFAEVNAWSKLQTDLKTGQPMRVLKKWVRY